MWFLSEISTFTEGEGTCNLVKQNYSICIFHIIIHIRVYIFGLHSHKYIYIYIGVTSMYFQCISQHCFLNLLVEGVKTTFHFFLLNVAVLFIVFLKSDQKNSSFNESPYIVILVFKKSLIQLNRLFLKTVWLLLAGKFLFT